VSLAGLTVATAGVPETKPTLEIVSPIGVTVAVRDWVPPRPILAVDGARLTVHDRTITVEVSEHVVPSSMVAVAVIVEVPPLTPVATVV
jgi:hypothetical protein